jgi:hypothetical protein
MYDVNIAFIVFLITVLYIYFNRPINTEYFAVNCDKNDLLTQKINEFESDNLKCLLDITNIDCKAETNKLYPISIMKTLNGEYLAIFNNGLLYTNDDIQSENLWRGPLSNSQPNENIKIRMTTYDKNGKLMGVGTDGLIYIKSKFELESTWQVTPLPNSGCVMYIMYDKDGRLLGVSKDGTIKKKEKDDITSEWQDTNGSDIPLLRIYWDLNGHLLGLGADFKLYQKNTVNWEISKWKAKTSPAKLFDVIYDKDARLYGVYINEINNSIELRKQNQAYYTSDFYPLFDVKIQGVTMLTNHHIIQTKMGSNFQTKLESPENSLNDVIDPSPEEINQEYILESQKSLRDLCASKKHLYNNVDYYDFELQRKIEEQESLIKNLNVEIDKYSQTDKKYTQMVEKTVNPNDIMQLIPK